MHLSFVPVGTALTILISVTTVAALLVMSLCFCLWKCFLRKEGECQCSQLSLFINIWKMTQDTIKKYSMVLFSSWSDGAPRCSELLKSSAVPFVIQALFFWLTLESFLWFNSAQEIILRLIKM